MVARFECENSPKLRGEFGLWQYCIRKVTGTDNALPTESFNLLAAAEEVDCYSFKTVKCRKAQFYVTYNSELNVGLCIIEANWLECS